MDSGAVYLIVMIRLPRLSKIKRKAATISKRHCLTYDCLDACTIRDQLKDAVYHSDLASINERERPQTASIGESEMMSKITAS